MIIVTGGAGFIGSNLIKGLNDKGISKIYVVDNLTNGEKHRNLNRLKIADFIAKEDFIKNLASFKNISTIFHQGACAVTTEADGRYMMANNFEYSKELLHFSLIKGIHFIYASSAAVYGNGENGFREDPVCEYPLNVYAYSKFLFDQYVRNIWDSKSTINSQITGLRYFNVYGPQENHKGSMASVAFHLFNQLQAGEPMKLFGGSENFRRDFVYVDDAVAVNLHFFEKRKSGIFNCGTGKAESFMEIANGVQSLDPKAKLKMIPFPDHLKGKYQTFTEADLTQLRKVGYKKPFRTLAEGVKEYYKIFQKTGGYL